MAGKTDEEIAEARERATMISDQECREVARRLRQFHRRDGETQLDFIAHMVYEKKQMTAADYSNLPSRLAELIDRPTCSMEYRPKWSGDELYPTSVYECSVCGHVVQEGKPDYCPGCGAVVADD